MLDGLYRGEGSAFASCLRDQDLKVEGPRFKPRLGDYFLAVTPSRPFSWYYSQKCWENGRYGLAGGDMLVSFSIMGLHYHSCGTTSNGVDNFNGLTPRRLMCYIEEQMEDGRLLHCIAFS